MIPLETYINQTYNALTITRIVGRIQGSSQVRVECLCKCGRLWEGYLMNVKSGATKSCGCRIHKQASYIPNTSSKRIPHTSLQKQSFTVDLTLEDLINSGDMEGARRLVAQRNGETYDPTRIQKTKNDGTNDETQVSAVSPCN